MGNFEVSTLAILLATCAGLLGLATVFLYQITRGLALIMQFLSEERVRGGTPQAAPSVAETSSGGAFEAFLSEDPSRRKLGKKEQFAAYRQWRQENGMNWSNS
ncbi:MAG: hypothetical protein ORN51_11515 [Akkermansiaceae bacterium]|nr:hypothetical protein [Akkermansiaceae bacterium]